MLRLLKQYVDRLIVSFYHTHDDNVDSRTNLDSIVYCKNLQFYFVKPVREFADISVLNTNVRRVVANYCSYERLLFATSLLQMSECDN